MDIREILKKVDHTLLGVTAGWSDIEQILIDAEKFGTASACIPPAFVKRAKEYVGDRVKICTVIGFPNGYNTTAVKVFETKDAVENGADEIDMVINVGELKSGNTVYVENEIKAVRAACEGKILKVIIETCLLTENFSEHIGSNVKMKAAGGISSLEDAEKFISLGCDRLGTSRIVKLAKGLDASGY